MKNLIFALAYLLLAVPSMAGTITVDDDGPADFNNIQAAIDDAEDADIVLVGPGRYEENINFSGKNITITSLDPQDPCMVAATVIDGKGSGSVVTFDHNETAQAVLTGFTITGGTGTYAGKEGTADLYMGGGIYCSGSYPTIVGNVITANHGATEITGDTITVVSYGGAIVCEEGGPTITRNIIKDNSAYAGAGVMVISGSAQIVSNLIYENSALIGGGAILLYGGQLVGNTIVANEGEQDFGNVYLVCNPEIGAGLVSSNIICNATNGGGIYVESESSDVVRYNNVYNNSGGDYPYMPDLTGTWGNISTDPCFIDASGHDFHLHAQSACINAGEPDAEVGTDAKDIDNQNRIYALRMDMGADEYVGYLPPIANAGPDQFLPEFELVTLDGSGSFFYDPNGVVEFHWKQISGVPVTLSDPNAMKPTFMPEAEGEYRFELIVSDGLNISEPDEVLIVIGNRVPVADAGADILVQVPQTVTLDGSGSFDPDPFDEISYWWRQVAGPNVSLSDPNTATPSFQCSEWGAYQFELIVYDGLAESVPSEVNVVTYELRVTQEPLEPGFSTDDYFHYPDISGDNIVYGVGYACDFTWNVYKKDLQTDNLISFAGGGIDTQPKIDGDLVVWFGGLNFENPWGHEPSNTSVFARNLVTGVQKTLREYTWSESYSHPVVSGSKVVWLEHLGLDPRPAGDSANNWWNTPYNICGAEVSNLSEPRYFTIAENVGTRDPYPCHTYTSDFDDVIDICGNIVVWEGDGDIYGADISNLNNIRVFTICDSPFEQFDPAISGNIVLWTDTRNDSGDIYGADISNLNDIKVFEVVRQPAKQEQPAIDGHVIVYVDVQDGLHMGSVNVCCLSRRHGVIHIPLSGSAYGAGPAVDGERIVWQSNDYWSGRISGVLLELLYTIADGPVENLDTGGRYDYIQMAIDDANSGDRLEAPAGRYFESVNFKGKNSTVRSTDPNNSAVVAATVIDGQNNGPVVIFSGGEDANCVLAGFTITGGGNEGGILCEGDDSRPTIRNCVIAGNAGIGINCDQSGPTITNCIIAGNGDIGIKVRGGAATTVTNCTIVKNAADGVNSYRGILTIVSSIIWANADSEIYSSPVGTYVTYTNVEGGWAGEGNIDADPCFIEPGYWDANVVWIDGDYHLKSQGWRWDTQRKVWTWDDVTSRCIDAGNPGSPLVDELLSVPADPNNIWGQNLRINMGAYGGTAEASMAPYDWAILGDLTNDGLVNLKDYAFQAADWLNSADQQPGDLNRDSLIYISDLALLVEDWLKQTTWHE